MHLTAYWQNGSTEQADRAALLCERAGIGVYLSLLLCLDSVMKFHEKLWTLPEGTHGYRKRPTKAHISGAFKTR